MNKFLIEIFLFFLAVGFLSCQADQKKIDKPEPVEVTKPQLIDITVEQARELISTNPEIIFIDVRTPEETAEGMIPGAMQLDVKSDHFNKHISALNKDQSYAVYCRSGKRSTKATKIMVEEGFRDLRNVEGGYLAWQDLK